MPDPSAKAYIPISSITDARIVELQKILIAKLAVLDNSNHGLIALRTVLDVLESQVSGSSSALAAPIAAILAAVALIPTTAMRGTDNAMLAASGARILCSMDFWSDLKEEVAVTGAQSTIALPTVTIANLPAGATIVRAIALFKFRMVENIFAGVNALDAAAALPIQVDDGAATGYVTAIDFVDDAFTLAASVREGGDVIIGDNNIAARVDGNDTYPVRWLNAKADQNNLQFNDVQVGLRIWYMV